MRERERYIIEEPAGEGLVGRIPHFWGWAAAALIVAVLAGFTYFLPKGFVLSLGTFFLVWWLIGGLAYRVRFARSVSHAKRGGLRLGGWALDGWHTRYDRHGSYWRSMRGWVRGGRRRK